MTAHLSESRAGLGPRAVAMPVFSRFWHGNARKALAQLDTNLTRT